MFTSLKTLHYIIVFTGAVWNKGDGVASLIESLHDSLKNGKVLVAGDTTSDLPMLQHAVSENPDVSILKIQ